ncbi:THUMP domain-containing protein 1 [Gigaspora margarita]|uniref:THUMP domain-containing protein 1 n=1 Tax=Gigaspora margarita TaxID=4874 RepID=A0A8H3WWP3_GIGMA|nr:THUMP domain-containing protein 1 [Gigaspora margarita]
MSSFQKRYSRSSGNSKSKKSKKPYYRKQSNFAAFKPGISGVFVSCAKNKEDLCIRECYDLFDAYADLIYKPDDSIDVVDEDEANKKIGDDIESTIAKELAQMKRPHTSRRFASIQTGTDCVVFIKTNHPVVPVQLVHYILTDLNNTKQKKTRFCKRLVPITQTCYTNINDIKKLAEEVLHPHFYTQEEDQKQRIKYAIIPNIRNNNKVNRMELIQQIASAVGDYHIVNLDKPDLVIIVEIFKNHECIIAN